MSVVFVQAYILETMFYASIIGCAIDFTFQFNWLRAGFALDSASDARFAHDVNMTIMDHIPLAHLHWGKDFRTIRPGRNTT